MKPTLIKKYIEERGIDWFIKNHLETYKKLITGLVKTELYIESKEISLQRSLHLISEKLSRAISSHSA